MREELRELRGEFKELVNRAGQPWAQKTTRDNEPHQWAIRGFDREGFASLAARAASLAGLAGWEAWLDHLETLGTTTNHRCGYGCDDDGNRIERITSAHLAGIAALSVRAIDAMLAATPPKPAAEGEPEKERKPKRATANQLMLDLIQRQPESRGWTVSQWCKATKRGKATIHATETWKQLETFRLELKATKATDRRRKSFGKRSSD